MHPQAACRHCHKPARTAAPNSLPNPSDPQPPTRCGSSVPTCRSTKAKCGSSTNAEVGRLFAGRLGGCPRPSTPHPYTLLQLNARASKPPPAAAPHRCTAQSTSSSGPTAPHKRKLLLLALALLLPRSHLRNDCRTSSRRTGPHRLLQMLLRHYRIAASSSGSQLPAATESARRPWNIYLRPLPFLLEAAAGFSLAVGSSALPAWRTGITDSSSSSAKRFLNLFSWPSSRTMVLLLPW